MTLDLPTLPLCSECGAPFTPRGRVQRTCGAPACQEKRAYAVKRAHPAYVAATRARCQRWLAAHYPDQYRALAREFPRVAQIR